MIDAEVIARDLKIAHRDFGEQNLFDAQNNRLNGFFMLNTEAGEEDRPSENTRTFRSPDRLALGATITDRKQGMTWTVKAVEGTEGSFYHRLELRP